VITSRLPATPETDESEGPEPGSLLAGPRNVKPYVAKRGEQYMSKEQLAHFRQILRSSASSCVHATASAS
jgi:hypothetical protein